MDRYIDVLQKSPFRRRRSRVSSVLSRTCSSAKRLLIGSALLCSLPSAMANITIVNMDGANEGFNDPTIVTAVGGNEGVTLGQQRLNVFNEAARLIALELNITQPIKVEAAFDPLACTSSSALLGYAGPLAWTTDEATQTMIPDALQNQLSGRDVDPSTAEISATFNVDLDNNANCIASANWYYGFDAPSNNDFSLLNTVLHELMHGLGFLSTLSHTGTATSWVQYGSEPPIYFYDPYTAKLKDANTGKLLLESNTAQRSAAIKSGDELVWSGARANALATDHTSGVTNNEIQLYAPTSYAGSSSVSHFNTTLTPDELMEPFDTGFAASRALSFAALLDIGWNYDAPVLSTIGPLSLNEDELLEVELSASDSDGDELTFSFTSDEEDLGVSLRTTTTRTYLVINPVENFYGEGNVTVSVSAGGTTVEETFTVTVNSVNDAPVLNISETDLRTMEEQALSVSFNASDVDHTNLEYSVEGLSSEIATTVAGNTITFTPAQDINGTFRFKIVVSDGTDSTKQDMRLIIDNINDLPFASISTTSGSILAEDTSWSTTVSYGDVDGLPVTVNATANVAATQVTLDDSVTPPTLSVIPPADFNGEIQVTLAVTENSFDVFGTGEDPATVTDTVTLTVSPVNDAPTLTEISNQSLLASDTLTLTLVGQDIDNDGLTYTITDNPQSLVASITGSQLTLTLDGSYIGTAELEITVSDDALSPLSASRRFLIEIGDDNVAPALGTIATLQSDEDTVINVPLTATDDNGDALTFSASGLPEWISAEVLAQPETGQAILQLTPAEDRNGEFTLTVSVSDGVLSDTQQVSGVFTAVNDAPVISADFPAVITMEEDSYKQVTIPASDAEADRYFFSLVDAPEAISVRFSGDIMILEPQADFYGEIPVTLRIYDQTDSNTETITIKVTPVNDRPFVRPIDDLNLTIETTANVAIPLTDIEGDAILSVVSHSPKQVQASLVDGAIQLTSPHGYNGQVRITVTAQDDDHTATRDFYVTVIGGQPLPMLSAYVGGDLVSNGQTLPAEIQLTNRPFHVFIYERVGDWDFSVMYQDEVRDDLLNLSEGNQVILNVPSTGPFAGQYDIIATAPDDVVSPLIYSIIRKPEISLDTAPLLIGSDKARIQVRGLPAGELIDVQSISYDELVFNPTTGGAIPVAANNTPANQNLTELGIGTDSTYASVMIVIAGYDDVWLSARAEAGIEHVLTLQDEQQNPLEDIDILLSNNNLSGWDIEQQQTTDAQGQINLAVPASDIGVLIEHPDYFPVQTTLSVNDTSPATVLTLQARPDVYELQITVNANDFDFDTTLPQLAVEFEDTSRQAISLSAVINDSTASSALKRIMVNWQWDGRGDVPTAIVINHPRIDEYRIELNPRAGSEGKTAYLWAQHPPEPGEQETESETESETGDNGGTSGTDNTGNGAGQEPTAPELSESAAGAFSGSYAMAMWLLCLLSAHRLLAQRRLQSHVFRGSGHTHTK